jgi:5'-3' exonuclease
MTGKYTLIFDGNFWLHKTYFIGQKIKQGKPFNFIDEPEADKNLLLWKLSVDFAAEIKRFEGITNRIVYTIDSSSWRKTVQGEASYKANRVKSNDIDWNSIYQVHDEFVKALEALGVTISRIKGAEADDLIFAWSSFLNQQGQNSMIISGDNDLLQLANMDKSSGANTLYYNKFDKDLHVFPGFKTWLDQEDMQTTNDIFNLPIDLVSNTKIHLRDIIRANKMKLDEVNTNEFIFKKILIGDAGDNVSPLDLKTKESKDGKIRTFRVTPNHANAILDEFKKDKVFINQTHLFNDDNITQICEIAKRVIKIEKEIPEIKDKWELNRNLVYLHKKCIPEKVVTDMLEQIEERHAASLSGSGLHTIMDKDKILGGTTYSKDKAELTDSSIFRSTMNTANPTKSSNEVKITSTPTSSGFDDKMWADLLK